MALNSALPTGPRAHKAAMVAVNSTMLALGTALPPITLGAAVDGRSITLGDGPLLVAFICNHCPFVLHLRPVLVQRLNAWHQQGLQVIAISSNDPVTHPQDGPIPMAALAKAEGFAFPYFFDADQSLAKTFSLPVRQTFFFSTTTTPSPIVAALMPPDRATRSRLRATISTLRCKRS